MVPPFFFGPCVNGFELARFQNSVSLVGLRYNAQDDLHSQGQHLIILQSDRGWGNSLLDTRYSEHAGPRVPNRFVESLTISPEPNMGRGGFVTAELRFRPRYALAKIGTNIWWFTFLVLSRRNNSYIYLGTSTGRSPRKFVCGEFFMDRPGEGFTAPPGDGPTTSLHYKMDGPNRGRPSGGQII